MLRSVLLVFVVSIGAAQSFLFSNGCGCNIPCAPPPICPPLPTCPPVQSCPAAVSRRKERVKRSIGDLAEAVYLVEFDENSKGDIRQKRDINDEVIKVDARCNNDVLRTIIVENIDRVTAVSKRRIQAECERRLEGRYNVICARGDFSYITSTEEFCQQTVGDVTCYVFKQLSSVTRARLS
ncbi:hypothetical protein Q1695_013952 [Nippostrongylus brasiliensis]|nr:hypothetical protein Q1695_013952 [Nippostrongylus brasiliensis]